jgi:hypothetical protein
MDSGAMASRCTPDIRSAKRWAACSAPSEFWQPARNGPLIRTRREKKSISHYAKQRFASWISCRSNMNSLAVVRERSGNRNQYSAPSAVYKSLGKPAGEASKGRM